MNTLYKTEPQTVSHISSFRGKHRFLSNFWPVQIELEGVTYPTVEHAYQAAKTTNASERLDIYNQPTPGKAKIAGRRVHVRPDWDRVKVYVIERLLAQKFRKGSMRDLLLATGNAELTEGNTWGDVFWGAVEGPNGWVGRNELGKALMRVREEIQ